MPKFVPYNIQQHISIIKKMWGGKKGDKKQERKTSEAQSCHWNQTRRSCQRFQWLCNILIFLPSIHSRRCGKENKTHTHKNQSSKSYTTEQEVYYLLFFLKVIWSFQPLTCAACFLTTAVNVSFSLCSDNRRFGAELWALPPFSLTTRRYCVGWWIA